MSQHASRGSMRPLLMMIGAAQAKTMYRNAQQINRERNASWYYGPLGLENIEATIAFIGDSTHRNQLQPPRVGVKRRKRSWAGGRPLPDGSKKQRQAPRALLSKLVPRRRGHSSLLP